MARTLAVAALAAALGSTNAALCGNSTQPLSASKPNVMIIGDSISMAIPYTPGGYGVNVQQLLGAKGIVVQHGGGWFSGGQASNTVKGLICTNASEPWESPYNVGVNGLFDVVSFNYGLHDLVNCTTGGECGEHVEPEQYGLNLQTIYAALKPIAKKLVFQYTTPVPNIPNMPLGRSYENAIVYNKAAVAALKAVAGPELSFSDLWTAVISVCGEGYSSCSLQRPNDVHFEPAGQAFLGQHVADSILAALGL